MCRELSTPILHQVVDFPELFLEVDRMKLAKAGINQSEVANDILIKFQRQHNVDTQFLAG